MSNNGSFSAIIARHDYLPFGEELYSGIGLRTSTQGYGATDTNRQKYGLTERDDATGLDHTWWRKYENLSGRWTSPDPYNGSISVIDPQSFSRYHYTDNDPINFVDPTGLSGFSIRSVWIPFPENYGENVGDPGGGGEMGLLELRPFPEEPQKPSPTPPAQPLPPNYKPPKDPCRDRPREVVLRDLRQIAKWIGWRIQDGGNPGPDADHQTFNQIADNLGKNHFGPFPWYKPNLNFPAHGNGFHYEGQLRPNEWYHVVIHSAQD